MRSAPHRSKSLRIRRSPVEQQRLAQVMVLAAPEVRARLPKDQQRFFREHLNRFLAAIEERIDLDSVTGIEQTEYLLDHALITAQNDMKKSPSNANQVAYKCTSRQFAYDTEDLTVLVTLRADQPSQALSVDQTRIHPEEVNAAFTVIYEQHSALQEGEPGRKPYRAERIYRVIQGRENEDIPLSEFAKQFPDGKNPRKRAVNAISWVNQTFRKLGIPLEIRGVTKRSVDKGKVETFYRLQHISTR